MRLQKFIESEHHDFVAEFLPRWIKIVDLPIDQLGKKWGITIPSETGSPLNIRINVCDVDLIYLRLFEHDDLAGYVNIARDLDLEDWLLKIIHPEELGGEVSKKRIWYEVPITRERLEFFANDSSLNAKYFRNAAYNYVQRKLERGNSMSERYNYPNVADYFREIFFKNYSLGPVQSRSTTANVAGELKINSDNVDLLIGLVSAEEGHPVLTSHMRRERNRGLRSKKLDEQRNSSSGIRCKACNCVPDDIYFTDEIVEIHHKVPLHISGKTEVRLLDLEVLCPNCHFAIHKYNASNPDVEASPANNYAPIFSETFQNQRNKQK